MKRFSLFFICVLMLVIQGCKQQDISMAVKKAQDQQFAENSSDEKGSANKTAKEEMVKKEKKSNFKPFFIYSNKGSRDNHYVPSGFMGSVKCITLNDSWQEGCQEGTSCMKFEYNIECSHKDQKWVGVYWLNPANNWGKRKGGFNLTGASKLVFWAKGELGGEQIEEFTVGGITGNYPDTDIAVIGPVILSTEWKKYEIDLRGKDLTYISGGFAWTTSDEVNHENVTFYIDNISFE